MDAFLNFLSNIFSFLHTLGIYIQEHTVTVIVLLLFVSVVVIVLKFAIRVSFKLILFLLPVLLLLVTGFFVWNWIDSRSTQKEDIPALEDYEKLFELAETPYHRAVHEGKKSLFQRVQYMVGIGGLEIPSNASYEEGIRLMQTAASTIYREFAFYFVRNVNGETCWEFAGVGRVGDIGIRNLRTFQSCGLHDIAEVTIIHTHPASAGFNTLPPSFLDIISVGILTDIARAHQDNPEMRFQVVDTNNVWTYDASPQLVSRIQRLNLQSDDLNTEFFNEFGAEFATIYEQERIYACEGVNQYLEQQQACNYSDGEREAAVQSILETYRSLGATVTKEPIGTDI